MTIADIHEIGASIAELAADHSSGSSEIAQRAATIFENLSRAVSALGAEPDRALIDWLCHEIRNAQPAMSVLANLTESVRVSCAGDRAPFSRAASAAASFAGEMRGKIDRAARRAAALLESAECVITHSRSGGVLAALLAATNRPRAIVTESRPLLEGRRLAAELAAHGLNVELIPDGSMGQLTVLADLALVGADAISPAGVRNKSGTLLLALCARELNVPFYVVADSTKRITAEHPDLATLSRRSPSEIWDTPPPGVSVSNLPFDLTPHALVTGFVDESGIHGPEEMLQLLSGQEAARIA